jgi:type I restriction enzyme, S subunit
MSTWVEKPLGEIADLAGGMVRTGPFGAQLHQHDYVTDGAVAVVMPKDMAGGKVRFDSIARIDQTVADGLREHRLHPGDIVLARRGDVGRAAWVDVTDGPLLCGTGSMRIHLPGGDVLPRFVHYYLQTNAAIGWLQGQAVGATMPNLNGAIVRALPVVYPDMVTQAAIVGTLDSIEHLIENNRRRIELLEQMAQAVYREWFVRLRYPGYEFDEAVDLPLGRRPAGCRVGESPTEKAPGWERGRLHRHSNVG